MSKHNNDKAQSYWANIMCPFFHNDNINSIVCEGYFSDSVVRHTFRCKGDREKWEKQYCMDIKGCAVCPVYQFANGKYEE